MVTQISNRVEPFGKTKSGILWCLHCQRTYREGEWREEDGYQMCPFLDCGGDAVLDAQDWDSFQEMHPEYPKLPELGKLYPAYPDVPKKN